MKKTFITLLVSTFMLVACGSAEKIDYEVANHYFYQIRDSIPTQLKVIDEGQFNRMFGMAAVMGKDGQPTPIDWQRQFVIAKVLPETDRQTEIAPISLLKTANGELQFNYRVSEGTQQSYTTQPVVILIVDRQYAGCDVTENVVP